MQEETLTNTGLKAFLDGCPQLEHLDLRKCFEINLDKDLEKQCLERIKEFKHPNDSTVEYPYDIILSNLILTHHLMITHMITTTISR
ncbi:hypothetical protein CARUB_v10003338mg [Capsella rubella]|uniref:Uncharacterized protein n=1 Tax=Capsella rubella TaxID=81985 RepID=R0FL11_9BRAS|nr:hypothetical protein CARUB_v10003338mg [Capsella rubella]